MADRSFLDWPFLEDHHRALYYFTKNFMAQCIWKWNRQFKHIASTQIKTTIMKMNI